MSDDPLFIPANPRPVLTIDDIVSERDRRLEAGFDFNFGDDRGVHRIGTTKADMIGWDEVSKGATAACLLGVPEAPMSIETNTGLAAITAGEWLQIVVAATEFRQPIWLASFALAQMNPIPADFADNRYWEVPANEPMD